MKGDVGWRAAWRAWGVASLVLVALAPGCESASLEELLAGKACDPAGACAPGYVCDTTRDVCVPEGIMGTGGQGGGSTPCSSPTDCPEPQSACEVPVCIAGQCGSSALPMGTEVVVQTEGDCKRTLCDGLGGVTERNDASDLPVDGSECTDDVCNSGTAENPPLEEGADCGSGTCDGEGVCVECVVASMCSSLPPNDECQERRCNDGTCGQNFTAAGTPLSAQSAGDCQVATCDGAGATSSVADDTDLPSDGNDCTADGCAQGSPTFEPVAAGEPCGNGLSCDAAGNCTGCTDAADCGTDTFCVQFACNGGTCQLSYTQAGTTLPASQQNTGDCQELRCNGTGGILSVAASTDIPPDDGNECTEEVCANGSPQLSPEPLNAPCTNGGTVCDGAGSCVECNVASQCTNQGTVCQSATCSSHTCGLADTASGTSAPVSAQTDGDCSVVLCDGAGGTTTGVDDTDLPVDGNDCTLDQCTSGMASNPPAPAGSMCGMGGVCDGSGACSNANKGLGEGCASGAECQSGACVDGVCCDGACSDACEVCDGALAAGSAGTCADVSSGEDPDVECSGGQTCDGSGACASVCGSQPMPPPAACPAACTGGCSGGVCVVDCNGGGACSAMSIACPAGFACEVQCGGTGSCTGATFDCPAKYACSVVCDGDCANAEVLCDSGTCDLACGGGDSCLGASLQCGSNRCTGTCAGGDFPAVTCGSSCDCTTCALPAGAACTNGGQCNSGSCAPEGVCCDVACAGTCEACTAGATGGTTGTCGPVLAGTDPAMECAGQATCDGAGSCNLKVVGAPCNNGMECQSGFCPPQEGVCCDEACSGTCKACRMMVTGQPDGSCASILPGTDPNNECPGPQTCNAGGSCSN